MRCSQLSPSALVPVSLRDSLLAHVLHEAGVIDEMAITQEVVPDVLPASSPERGPFFRLLQQRSHSPAKQVEVSRVVEEHTSIRRDLIDDPSDGGRHNWPGLPHCLRNGQSETLLEALLHNDAGVALHGVDHEGVRDDVVHGERHEAHVLADSPRQRFPSCEALGEDL